MRGRGRNEQWLLIKMKDEFARPESEDKQPPRQAAARTARNTAVPRRARRRTAPELPTVTHGDKVLFPDLDITKGQVFEFYRRIAPHLLPHLRDRPATLERLPEGLTGRTPRTFWQKNASTYYPRGSRSRN